MTFEPVGRWYSTEITERAAEFANGDSTRIVAAAFARFLAERRVEFDWSADKHDHFMVGGYWSIRVLATTETTDTLTPDNHEGWTMYGNVAIPGLVCLMGLNYRTEPFDVAHLLSLDEFLKGVTPLVQPLA